MENILASKVANEWAIIDLIENTHSGNVYYKLVEPGNKNRVVYRSNLKTLIQDSWLDIDKKDELRQLFFPSQAQRDRFSEY